jgi:alkylation response protein AidB-like acyl-CoA dehydrogenase
MGATAVEAIRVQRAIGSRAPSLAVATTMHHFSAATLVELWKRDKGLEWMLLQGIAERHVLLASGFAEGVSGQGVLRPSMQGRRAADKVRISGAKKPCSLSRSMDILTASVLVSSEDPEVEDEFGVALISADLPGIEIAPFWCAPVLTGAESDAVTLEDVHVEEALVITMGSAKDPELDEIQAAGFLWFELLITASYIGMASALVERVLLAGRGDAWPRIAGAVELEAAMASLEAIAQQIVPGGTNGVGLLSKALHCRYAAQDAISRAVASAVELLGGMAFIREDEVGYFAAASRALAFHPPARSKTAMALADAFGGAELKIG